MSKKDELDENWVINVAIRRMLVVVQIVRQWLQMALFCRISDGEVKCSDDFDANRNACKADLCRTAKDD